MMQSIVSFENVAYRYTASEPDAEETEALSGLNLEIKPGEFLAVIGHNGSGKSTLAKHINALLLPTDGVVWVKGMDTRSEAQVWDIRQSAGMVFQNPDNQLVATVVEEDVAFGPENLGVDPPEIRRRVDEALENVGMSAYRDNAPSMLSGGQKQRIAIAGVLAMRPEVMVLDEPTAMLDPSGRAEVMQTVQRLNRQEGITVVNITHFMEEAALADRVVVMDRGAVVMSGTPQEVFTHVEQLKAIGLDVPPAVELAWRLRQDGVPLPEGIIDAERLVTAICPLLLNS
ncbi:MAG: energy-coupling factor transporter ATPase [Christensenellales bacterium]|jgi:energy-coupling factor transport system ATP-binding protein